MSHTAKLHRWIDLITALLSRRYGATFDELRDLVPQYHGGSLARARRTFERDKDDLRRLGVPLDTHVSSADDESRYTITTTAFYLPYLALVTPRGMRRPRRVDRYGYRALGECQFTDTEVTLLADAAARVMVFGDPVLQADARQAMARLAVDLPADALRPTPNVTVMPGRAAARGEVLAQLGEALLRRKQVSFSYYGIERDDTEQRTVLPYGLAFTAGHWYLHAQDPARGALRRFRVSRIHHLTVNAHNPGRQDFEIPAHFRLADHATPVSPWSLGPGVPSPIVLRFTTDNGAVRAARRLGRATPDEAIVQYEVRRRDPFFRWVLALAGDAAPIGPPDAVRDFHALVERTYAAHAGDNA